MSLNTSPQFEQSSTIRDPFVPSQPDWDQLFSNPSQNEVHDLSFSQPTDYQSFEQPVQPSNCVPFPQPTEHLRCAEPIPSSDFLANQVSTKAWCLNQDTVPSHATSVPRDAWSQADLSSGLEERITIEPGEFHKLKQAVNTLGDRCKALEETVPKLQDGMEESNRNFLQLRDCLNGFMAWTVQFKEAADDFVEDTRARVESIEQKE